MSLKLVGLAPQPLDLQPLRLHLTMAGERMLPGAVEQRYQDLLKGTTLAVLGIR